MKPMDSPLADARLHANDSRYHPGQQAGHYESFFLRANHPSRPLAFWIRYTIFSPRHHPEQAQGELWAIAFNGETGRHVAVKHELPFADCTFSPSQFSIHVGEAQLESGRLVGAAESRGHAIRWDLRYTGDAPPLLLLSLDAYAAPQPKAKSLVGRPFANFSGTLVV